MNTNKVEYICDSCEEGLRRKCPHAMGIHYNPWGEGSVMPDWCPQRSDELLF